MLRQHYHVTKPPPYARVDLTHPLGRCCQMVCLFNQGQGPVQVPSGMFADTWADTPFVQYYQTMGNRLPLMVGGANVPTWTVNSAGRAMSFGGADSFMDLGLDMSGFNGQHDLDYPQFAPDATVTCGKTVCVIRRKVDTTLRASALFGQETHDGIFPLSHGYDCHALVPYSDGNVYWDYGGTRSAPNRLIVTGLTFTTNVEKWVFHAGARGSAVWRDGIKVGEQSTALTRVCFNNPPGNWWGGNLVCRGGGSFCDPQEINFIMHLATQWSDEQCRWWAAEPYAAFYADVATRWMSPGDPGVATPGGITLAGGGGLAGPRHGLAG